jgi:hypothetical protein
MASFRSVGTVTDSSGVDTIEISAASGIQDGDLLCICGFADNNVSLTLNEGGWTEQTELQDASGGDKVLALYTRIAASESGTYTLDLGSGTARMIGAMLAYTDVDQVTPMDATVTTASGTVNSDQHDPAAITTVTNNAIVVSFVGAVQTTSGSRTVPSGYTERVTSGATDMIGVADIDVATAGSEDPSVWTGLGSSADSASITFAIRPAAGGGAGSVILRRRR